MHIGIDFDNTIVSYDGLFHKIALERSLIPIGLPVDKVAVRDYLRLQNQEDVWTEMQGYVYGARMDEAMSYNKVQEFMFRANKLGHKISIVSHKTKHPFVGPAYDLHTAALCWIKRHLMAQGDLLISPENVYFELTKESKLSRIGAIGCDVFIDDLPEILLAEGFPSNVSPVLFDPDDHHVTVGLPRFTSWPAIGGHLAF